MKIRVGLELNHAEYALPSENQRIFCWCGDDMVFVEGVFTLDKYVKYVATSITGTVVPWRNVRYWIPSSDLRYTFKHAITGSW